MSKYFYKVLKRKGSVFYTCIPVIFEDCAKALKKH